MKNFRSPTPTSRFGWQLLVCLLLAMNCQVQAQVANVKALVGGTLIDGYGSTPIRNSVIIIEGERIKAVGQVGTMAIPKGAQIISTEGMTVLPGLWDMHVHLMINGHSDYDHWDKTYPPQMEKVIMPASARQLLMAGVTSARDLGGPLQASIAVRDRIKRGEIPGPTLYVSGPFIQHEPYPGTAYVRWGVKGAADARAKVRKLASVSLQSLLLVEHSPIKIVPRKCVRKQLVELGRSAWVNRKSPGLFQNAHSDNFRAGFSVCRSLGCSLRGVAVIPVIPLRTL